MAIDAVTKEDLEAFRARLLEDIRELLITPDVALHKPWLRGKEVKKLLNISEGSLQQLRISGKLSGAKIGGIYYYRYQDIEKMMNDRDGSR